MEWLNYHHLFYFWAVAREGSIARARERLHLSQPAISAQIRALERSLGERLFERAGRGLVLTEIGRLVQRYANEIFTLGGELQDAVKDRPTGRPLRFTVGVADVLPKMIAYRLIEPSMHLSQPVHVICVEDRPERLLAGLSGHELDVVLSDSPAPPGTRVRVFSHLLGRCTVSLFGRRSPAGRRRWPLSEILKSAPFLLPTDACALRRSLDRWFDLCGIRPRIVGEFDDSALMKAFGQAGAGVFPAPSVLTKEICRMYDVSRVARLSEVQAEFYAISAERKLKHPAVVAICDSARHRFLGCESPAPARSPRRRTARSTPGTPNRG